MPAPTLHQDPDRTGYHRPASPPRTHAVDDPAAEVAALYPGDAAAAQRLLAEQAVDVLRRARRLAQVGSYGIHATCETAVPGGTLVLVPMAALVDLDADLADEDDQDPAVWHVLVRDPEGALVEDPLPEHSCPSVLWAVRAGIDPQAAVGLVAAVQTDPYLSALLGGRL